MVLDQSLPLAGEQGDRRLFLPGFARPGSAALFDGVASGLLGPDDLDEAATALEPGTSAGVLVYENVWAQPFAAALRRTGGHLAAAGHIPIQELVAALDAVEAAESVG